MRVEIDKRSGFCFGVIKAIKSAESELKTTDKLYCLGDIVHNGMEVERLEKMGLHSVTREEYMQLKNCKVLIRAHGEPPETYQYAKENNIELIDATCPVVLTLQEKVKGSYEKIKNRNGQVVIYGKKGHAEIIGLDGQIENKAIVLESIDDVNQIDFSRPVSLYSQTTKRVEDFYAIADKVKKSMAPGVPLEIKDSICRQVSNQVPHLKKFILQQEIDPTPSPLTYLSLTPKTNSRLSAFVPIMTGCNNFCSYCVVPYTRGREFSRPGQEIIKEIKSLTEKGAREIILLGQNVNSYQDKNINFPELLQMIDNLPGNFWLTFLTSHPKDLSDELIAVMAKSKKIIKYLHLAVQSGDNDILKKMNRYYTVQEYKNLIKKIKKQIPQLNVSTDVIVGFPGETKKQFKKTKQLLKRIKFDMVYIAQYSPRPGTKAAQMEDNVLRKEKRQREKTLNKILEKTALKNNKKLIGQTLEILVENCQNNQYYGKTKNFKNIKIEKKDLKKSLSLGEFIKVKIIKATAWGLEGILD